MPDEQRGEQPDLYELLGVAPTSSRDEITSAFRHLVRTLHPDANVGIEVDSAALIRVIEAYEVLAQPHRRRQYDQSRRRRTTTIPVRVQRQHVATNATRCTNCAGTGAEVVHCPRCGGHGYVLRPSPWLQQPVRCPLCHGVRAVQCRCRICKGTGLTSELPGAARATPQS
jgi:DnaJ-class molecular chaperone